MAEIWQTKGGLDYLTSSLFPQDQLIHAFSSRLSDPLDGPDNFNLSDRLVEDKIQVDKNRDKLLSILFKSPPPLAYAQQVHGGRVAQVGGAGDKAQQKDLSLLGVDGLVTDQAQLALFLFFADCVPLFFYDPKRPAIGLAHAGWKGLIKDVCLHTVQAMMDLYKSRPEDIRVYIGPSIEKEAFVVKKDLADLFSDKGYERHVFSLPAEPPLAGGLAQRAEKTYRIDLKACLQDQLRELGILQAHIDRSSQGTYYQPQDFFSYRRQGTKAGRMAAIMALA